MLESCQETSKVSIDHTLLHGMLGPSDNHFLIAYTGFMMDFILFECWYCLSTHLGMRGIIIFILHLWVVFSVTVVDHQQFSQKPPLLAIFTIIDGVLFGSDNWKEQCNFLFLLDGVSWFLKKVSISLVEFAFDVAFVQTSSGSGCWNRQSPSDGHVVDSVRNLACLQG